MTSEILKATCDQAHVLTELAIRSKAHWGYSAEFMAACREELSVTPSALSSEEMLYYVYVDEGVVQGFYALRMISASECELEALFVDPEYIGFGVGKVLICHAKATARALGIMSLQIQGDPHAASFYLAAGAQQVGERESASVPGRFLPLFEIQL